MLEAIRNEPAVTRGLVALVLVVAAYFGLDLPEEVVWTALAALGFATVTTRRKVTPTRKRNR